MRIDLISVSYMRSLYDFKHVILISMPIWCILWSKTWPFECVILNFLLGGASPHPWVYATQHYYPLPIGYIPYLLLLLNMLMLAKLNSFTHLRAQLVLHGRGGRTNHLLAHGGPNLASVADGQSCPSLGWPTGIYEARNPHGGCLDIPYLGATL